MPRWLTRLDIQKKFKYKFYISISKRIFLIFPYFNRAAKCITDPELSRKTTLSIVTIIYVCAFFVAFPNSYYSRISDGQCYPHWPSKKSVFSYYVVFVVVSLFIPLAIATFMYLHIGVSVHSSSRQNSVHTYSKQRQKENNFLYKTMVVTIMVFALLTAPYAAYVIVYMTLLTFDQEGFDNNYNLMMSLNYVIFTLSATNSCVNPLIYGRRAIGRGFFCGSIICKKLQKKNIESEVSSIITKYVANQNTLVTRWISNSVLIDDVEDTAQI